MEQFDLRKYLDNPSRKVITRDGKSARIICTNRLDKNYPVLALVNYEDYEMCHSYTTFGKLYTNQTTDCELDLFFVPEKKSGWINVYRGNGGYNTFVCNRIFATKEEAQKEKRDIIATIKIEWEE